MKTFSVVSITVLCLLLYSPLAYVQPGQALQDNQVVSSAAVKEKLILSKKKQLKKLLILKSGPSKNRIRQVMGEPEFATLGSGNKEIWFYNHHTVRIVFKKGKVVKWNFRFLEGKRPFYGDPTMLLN